MIRIIGIDPGLAHTGYGIIEIDKERYRHIEHGTIVTHSGEETGKRLLSIFDALTSLIERHKPGLAGVEELFFAKNISSAMRVAEAKGVVFLALERAGVETAQYSPQVIKQSIVGRGRAEKSQVQEMIRVLLGLKEVPGPDHASDALAAAICHYHHVSMNQTLAGKKR